MAILKTNDVNYKYQSKYQTVHAVRGISYEFEEGKFYAIVGKSGCGKTTFLSIADMADEVLQLKDGALVDA